MTSLIDARAKSMRWVELKQRYVDFARAGRRLQQAKGEASSVKSGSLTTCTNEGDAAGFPAIQRLALLELDIFSTSIERNTLRDRLFFSETKLSQLLKVFHTKRKQFFNATAAKEMTKERLESLDQEARRGKQPNQF